MTRPRKLAVAGKGGRATVALSAILLAQAFAAVFFIGDVVSDIALEGLNVHVLLELVVSLALVAGVVFGVRVTRDTVERLRRSEVALGAAQGAMGELVEARFAEWGLSSAEAEVAMMAMKGLDNAAIAEIRGTAQGTVRAQLAKVYAKAKVAGRGELASVFMDDLLGAPLVPNQV